MKRNMDLPILDLKNKPVQVGVSVPALTKALAAIWSNLSPELQKKYADAAGEDMEKALTLGDVCISVLQHPYEDERTLDMPTRTKRMKLALKLVEGGEQEITPEERDLIKPLLVKGVYGGPLVPVRAAELLEKETEPLQAVA